MSEFLKRRERASGAGGSRPDPRNDQLLLKYPALGEWLSLEQWPDGKVRETGTMLVCWQDGRWKAWLNDRDAQETAWISADTLEGLLEAVDGGIRRDSLEWRGVPKNRRKR